MQLDVLRTSAALLLRLSSDAPHQRRALPCRRTLTALLTQNGFVDITLDAAVGLVTDFATADRNFEFTRAASSAAEARLVSEGEAYGWIDELREADRKHLFVCSALSFRAAGRKPEEPLLPQ